LDSSDVVGGSNHSRWEVAISTVARFERCVEDIGIYTMIRIDSIRELQVGGVIGVVHVVIRRIHHEVAHRGLDGLASDDIK
jgi:hypothetical protein